MPFTLRDASRRTIIRSVTLLVACCLSLQPILAVPVLAQPARAQKALAQDKPARDALARITRAGELRIGVTGDYRPFSFRTPAGVLVGADVAMASDFARTIGVRPVFVMTTWASLSDDFSAGRFDMAIGGVSVDPARARLGLFSQPYVSDGKRPVVRCADAGVSQGSTR